MQVVTNPRVLQEETIRWRREGLTIGFVPTMGFLHEGHLSLIERARAKADKVVVSIFVNPTQFAPNEDLASYPRDPVRDQALVESAGGDILFMPSDADMYDPHAATWVEVPSFAKNLCGASRPTHFRGVCTVVAKLFNIVQPHYAFFGEKDWQQLALLRRMVCDLMFPVELVGCPIVREDDGLARSSRNVNLLEQERAEAPYLNKGLELAKRLVEQGARDVAKVIEAVEIYYNQHIFLGKIDYLSCVDPDTIENLDHVETRCLFAVAMRFSKVRLIDNRLVCAQS
jgi:pantoate--beta-alanine ligase